MTKKNEPTLRALIPTISFGETLFADEGRIVHPIPARMLSPLDAFAHIWFIKKHEPHDMQPPSTTKLVFNTYPSAHSCTMFWHEPAGKELRSERNEIVFTGDEDAMRPLFQYTSDGGRAINPQTPSLLPSLILSKLMSDGCRDAAQDLEMLAAYGIDAAMFERLKNQKWLDIATANDLWIAEAPEQPFIMLLRVCGLA